jgi:hypothetical protein
MKTKIVSAFLIAAAVSAGGLLAQTATMTSSMPAPSTPAPVVAPSAAPTPNQIVYSPRLPSAAELSSAAAAQGLTVVRIEQSNSQMVAVYQYSNGQTNTVAYQLLPANGAPAAETAQSGPAPTVVYADSPRVVYYDGPGYYPGYYPYYWYPPVSVGIGLGFRGGYGFHGGFGFRGRFR